MLSDISQPKKHERASEREKEEEKKQPLLVSSFVCNNTQKEGKNQFLCACSVAVLA